MTESTVFYEESICSLTDKGFGCIPLGNNLVAVYESTMFSNNMKVRIWDQHEKKYISNSWTGSPAKGTITPEDYAHLILKNDEYTLEATDSNKIIVVERKNEITTSTPATNIYTSEVNGSKVSLLVVGGVVIACTIGLTVLYFTKNPPLAGDIGLKSGEVIGGAALRDSVGKFLNIIGSYFIINLMNDNGQPTGFAAAFTEAQEVTVPKDPLLIDIDGDGIETTSVENGVYFDQENDGFAEKSAWVGKDDGVLAYDKNNNGRIDDGNEIFGDSYVKTDGTTGKISDYELQSDPMNSIATEWIEVSEEIAA